MHSTRFVLLSQSFRPSTWHCIAKNDSIDTGTSNSLSYSSTSLPLPPSFASPFHFHRDKSFFW